MVDNYYFKHKMKKNKLNPELLKEELKRFRLLNEYDFYQETTELPEKELILGDIEEQDEPTDPASAISADLGLDAGDEGGETSPADTTSDVPAEPATTEPATGGDVEVDVTSLVKGSEEAKQAADAANKNTEMLMQQLQNLESRIANMDKVSAKIEDLEKEIIKRNPTPVEKLEMRSLSSFPYSQKLTDYWADKNSQYDVTDNGKEEYTLTQSDVDYDYSEPQIKKSFRVNPEDVNPYQEEDI